MFRRSRLVLLFFTVFLVGGLVAALFWSHHMAGQIFVRAIDPDLKLISPTPNPYGNLIQEHLAKKTPFNILLLGYGGGDHDGTYLTDTIIVANIDPSQNHITLISIPRDIWLPIPPANEYRKINAAFFENMSGGIAAAGLAAKNAVQTVTGLPIDYFVSIDFAGFKKAIDALGGVDVKVDVTFDDYQYPISGMEEDLCGLDPTDLPAYLATASAAMQPQEIFPCRYEHLHFDKGVAHMDGETALKYVRSRHSAEDGNDFARSRRQKNLLVAVKQQVLTINFIPKIIPFANSLGTSVRTDLSVKEGAELVQNAQEFSQYTISSLALTDENYLQDSYSIDRQYILIPRSGIDQWDTLHQWLATQLLPTPIPSAN